MTASRLRRASARSGLSARTSAGVEPGPFSVTGVIGSRSGDSLEAAEGRNSNGIAIPYTPKPKSEIRFRIHDTGPVDLRVSRSSYVGKTRKEPGKMTTAREYLDRRWTALILLCVAQFVVVLDASIVNVALPSIGKGLDFSEGNLPWVVNAYVIAFGGFLLLGGRAADLLGRRRVFMAGLLLVGIA